ncbi:MAG TPA: hypothetical protein ENN17_07610 [bacterium]|nr:hypothetical protein [bacterium]
MIISRVHIKAFKSIRELVVPLDRKVTVLIGPNESGKTNILKAVESFHSELKFTNELTCQYSDFYHEGKPPVVGLEFINLTKEERIQLIKMYDGFRNVDSFILFREGPDLTDFKIQTDDKLLAIGNVKPLLSLLPKIMYFDSIPIIRDKVNLDNLRNNHDKFRTEMNLLKIGGVEDPALIFEDSTRGRRATEETGRIITQNIREVWTQEPSLEIKLRVNGDLLYIDFSDATTVYDTPKSRSNGFLWYLSFYINFIATTAMARANEYLFLLDEPGTHLHPSGQKDLSGLLDNLADKNQLVFTTHSPFMINRSQPERVRVVNKDEKGTSVDNEAYRENWKPLRQSIGLTVADLFFFSTPGSLPDHSQTKTPLFKIKRGNL